MAYQFSAQKKASALVNKGDGTTNTYKIAGINGQQTSADNLHTAITGLLNVVGKNASDGLGRQITQDVEEVP